MFYLRQSNDAAAVQHGAGPAQLEGAADLHGLEGGAVDLKPMSCQMLGDTTSRNMMTLS